MKAHKLKKKLTSQDYVTSAQGYITKIEAILDAITFQDTTSSAANCVNFIKVRINQKLKTEVANLQATLNAEEATNKKAAVNAAIILNGLCFELYFTVADLCGAAVTAPRDKNLIGPPCYNTLHQIGFPTSQI